LVTGTMRENNQDRARAWRGPHKLTRAQVLDIKARVVAGERQADLARQYGVTRPNINHIVKGRQGVYADAASGAGEAAGQRS
jgi:DNA-binding XRE family transcriptional regulator